MPDIPEGEYFHPLGKLVVRSSENYHAIVEFWAGDSGVPESVAALTWFWNTDSFDGSETTGKGAIPEEVLAQLKQGYEAQ